LNPLKRGLLFNGRLEKSILTPDEQAPEKRDASLLPEFVFLMRAFAKP
jgi:hypothetical protein